MKNFEIEQIDDGIIIKKYIGNCDIVNIPEEHDGKKVFLIANGAFKNSKVKRCTHIGSSAFTDCHK